MGDSKCLISLLRTQVPQEADGEAGSWLAPSPRVEVWVGSQGLVVRTLQEEAGAWPGPSEGDEPTRELALGPLHSRDPAWLVHPATGSCCQDPSMWGLHSTPRPSSRLV